VPLERGPFTCAVDPGGASCPDVPAERKLLAAVPQDSRSRRGERTPIGAYVRVWASPNGLPSESLHIAHRSPG
jgi:hypothetical protein